MRAELILAVTSFLEDQLGDALVAAFIYGSAATGRTHSGSDIDCFALTGRELTWEERQQTRARFADLQVHLGFTPDPDYPIEIFSVAACESLLDGPLLDTVVRDAAGTGTIDLRLVESDEVEVLRALLDRRLVLHPARELDKLTARANSILNCRPTDTLRLKRALRLTRDTR